MKDLVTNKEKFKETSKVTLNEKCSAVLLNKIHLKERDPWSFTIPCAIGKLVIDKAFVDLGASISLMPYFMFVRLDLGDLKPIRMYIELANRSTRYPKGIAENVIVQIDKFVFPLDFVILDMEEDSRDNLLKDQLDSFLLKAVEGYQPSNDEIGSINLWDEEAFDAESELRRSLKLGDISYARAGY
ncbi:zf-CCHC domain-containing protein, partial [Tanacetum coccineum]